MSVRDPSEATVGQSCESQEEESATTGSSWLSVGFAFRARGSRTNYSAPLLARFASDRGQLQLVRDEHVLPSEVVALRDVQ